MTLQLRRIKGPDCPGCGCPDSRVLCAASNWGETTLVKRRCLHCGLVFRAAAVKPAENGEPEQAPEGPRPPDGMPRPPDGMVVYQVIRCPPPEGCGSTDTHITRTKRPVRYHKCRACGYTFKSIERIEKD